MQTTLMRAGTVAVALAASLAMANPALAYSNYTYGSITSPSAGGCSYKGFGNGYAPNMHIKVDIRRFNTADTNSYITSTDLYTSGSGSWSTSTYTDYGTYRSADWPPAGTSEMVRVRVYKYGSTTTIGLDEDGTTSGCHASGSGSW